MTCPPPRYCKTIEQGLMEAKIKAALAHLDCCRLCPRQCRVNRNNGEKGFCNAANYAEVSSFSPHFGEEAPLSGTRGSGTIFFTHCNLRCLFCQNYDISITGGGEQATTDQLAAVMLYLQNQGCHNINLVTPAHMLPFILQALNTAAQSGLNLPLVYNCSGYESLATLKILNNVVDIYMPDFKFWDPGISKKACQALDYPEIARAAIKEMFNQVGDLTTDSSGIARSGLLVRHLVLPEDLAGTQSVMAFLAEKVSADTHVNIMSQYRPTWKAATIKELSRSVNADEFRKAAALADEYGLVSI